MTPGIATPRARDRRHAGSRRRGAWLALVIAAVLVGRCGACPFCGVVGESLAERRDRAAALAVGEPAGPVRNGADGLPRQPLEIVQLLRRDDALAATAGGMVEARVPGPISGTALLFADGDQRDAAWSAIAADETLLGHVIAAPPITEPAAERLRWFAARLEHADPAIAADAFTEFGRAPYAAVRAVADAFDIDTLRRWINELAIDQRRRGFYGLALGLAGAAAEPTGKTRAREALRAAIAAPADDFRAGFDGLLGGLLVVEGADGLDTIESLGLLDATARPVDQRHVLSALRFAWENLAGTVPRSRIAAATARLTAAPVVAADATIDLARYAHWDAVDAVAALWHALGDDDPLVRRAVAGYLTACPLPRARTHLEALRAGDPARLDQAIEAARLPLAR